MTFDKNNPSSINKHRRRFIGLATLILGLAGAGHLIRAIYGWSLLINGYEVPVYLSWLAVAMTFLMVLMGITYLKK